MSDRSIRKKTQAVFLLCTCLGPGCILHAQRLLRTMQILLIMFYAMWYRTSESQGRHKVSRRYHVHTSKQMHLFINRCSKMLFWRARRACNWVPWAGGLDVVEATCSNTFLEHCCCGGARCMNTLRDPGRGAHGNVALGISEIRSQAAN